MIIVLDMHHMVILKKNKKWIQTNKPVKLLNDDISNVILGCILIFSCIFL